MSEKVRWFKHNGTGRIIDLVLDTPKRQEAAKILLTERYWREVADSSGTLLPQEKAVDQNMTQLDNEGLPKHADDCEVHSPIRKPCSCCLESKLRSVIMSQRIEIAHQRTEVTKLTRELDREERSHAHTIRDRDYAQDKADTMAAAILQEEQDWSDHETKWEEAIDRLPLLLQLSQSNQRREAEVENVSSGCAIGEDLACPVVLPAQSKEHNPEWDLHYCTVCKIVHNFGRDRDSGAPLYLPGCRKGKAPIEQSEELRLEVGCTVECVKAYGDILEVGKQYKVEAISQASIMLEGDTHGWWKTKDRFKVIAPAPSPAVSEEGSEEVKYGHAKKPGEDARQDMIACRLAVYAFDICGISSLSKDDRQKCHDIAAWILTNFPDQSTEIQRLWEENERLDRKYKQRETDRDNQAQVQANAIEELLRTKSFLNAKVQELEQRDFKGKL